MKKFLFPLLIIFLFAACKDDKDSEPKAAPTKAIVNVMKQQKASDGSMTAEPKSAIIHVWKADEAEFDVEASGSNIQLGSAYDKNSGTYKTAVYGAIGSKMDEQVRPGRYFVYVMLMKSSTVGSLAYSYTYFEVKKGETVELKKIFSYNIKNEQFEEWNKNQ